MFMPELKRDGNLLPRHSKPRSTGLKEVSVKNNRSIDSISLYERVPQKQKPYSSYIHQNARIQTIQKNQFHNSTKIPSQFLEIFPKPTFQQTDNTLILDHDIDSRIIFKIHSTKELKNQIIQAKSIKIGSKAQKYRQNNKSEPKKVFNFENLSSLRCQNKVKIQIKEIKEEIPIQSRRTQRKNSPNIFVCTKNTHGSTEFGTKLKKFEEDLKKTKKPNVMKLQLQTGRIDYKIPQKKLKGTMSLKNHQMQPKLQPNVFNDIKISSSPESYCNRISSTNSIFPGSKFHFAYGQPLRREQISALQKTKKITSHFIQNFEMVSPRFPEQTQKKYDFTDTKHIEGLIPTNEVKFVLDRLCSDSKKTTQSRHVQHHEFKPSSMDSISFPESSSLKKFLPEQQFQTQKKDVKIFTFKELETPNLQAKQSFSLRVIDYAKKTQISHGSEESALSDRRNVIFKTNEKKIGQKAKIHSLNEGAKTIITNYDSSQKRSIVDESIIIFQCSKDLKPSFSRQILDKYAAKYRGSLGVETLIKQNEEDEMLTNQRNSNYPDQNYEQTGFENILFNSNSNNGGKLRKSYSIKEVEASINF